MAFVEFIPKGVALVRAMRAPPIVSLHRSFMHFNTGFKEKFLRDGARYADIFYSRDFKDLKNITIALKLLKVKEGRAKKINFYKRKKARTACKLGCRDFVTETGIEYPKKFLAEYIEDLDLILLNPLIVQ